jgi:hypothetical protein
MKPGQHLTTEAFYASLPVIDAFTRLTEPAAYTPLPEGWVLGLSDVVQSTAAIESGRYKAVNTAGAALIAAVANKIGAPGGFPYAFGGDGASFAVAPPHGAAAREALALTAAWTRDDLGLPMRAALVPVEAIRAAGHDVRVARFAPSPHVAYAMFSGGGTAFADAQMKQGAFAVSPAPKGDRPDLTGLSCRFDEIRARRGTILSLIVVPASPAADPSAFRDLALAILEMIGDDERASSPLPEDGPPMRASLAGFGLEARAARGKRSLVASRLTVGLQFLLGVAVIKSRRKVGPFDPVVYLREVAENSDFRKFDDGLRMTIDCTPALADRIEACLVQARAQGIARYGLARQGSALMTCFVPSHTSSDHVHFIDGAMGGYAAAARALKQDATATSAP